MAGAAPPKYQRVAFNFELTQRNAQLAGQGMDGARTMKTGTTIVGVLFNGGVVLGADTRASAGSEVAEKKCQKIHKMAPNIYCCGAGTAADCDHVTKQIMSSLKLFRYQNQRETRVKHAETLLVNHLHRYQGYLSAHLILGGVDLEGAHLLQITEHGFVKRHRYMSMGSGSIHAETVLDSRYKDDITEAEAIQLVEDAITAGIYNDNGSGGNIDMCIMKKVDGKTDVDYRRPHKKLPVESYQRKFPIEYPKGTTKILTEEITRRFEISPPMEVEA